MGNNQSNPPRQRQQREEKKQTEDRLMRDISADPYEDHIRAIQIIAEESGHNSMAGLFSGTQNWAVTLTYKPFNPTSGDRLVDVKYELVYDPNNTEGPNGTAAPYDQSFLWEEFTMQISEVRRAFLLSHRRRRVYWRRVHARRQAQAQAQAQARAQAQAQAQPAGQPQRPPNRSHRVDVDLTAPPNHSHSVDVDLTVDDNDL